MRSPLILRIFKDGQLVGVKQFDQDQVVVGHNADVHLDLDAEGVSPIHCLLEKRDSGWYVSDLGSTTGTFKNGQAVLDEAVGSGDELTIGAFKLSFFVGVPKPQVPPVVGGAGAVSQAVPPPHTTVVESEASMPPASVVKAEVIEQQIPVIPVVPPPVIEQAVPALPEFVPVIEEVPVAAPKAAAPKAAAPKVAIPVVAPIILNEVPATPAVKTAPAVVKPEIQKPKSAGTIKSSKKTFAPIVPLRDLKKEWKPTSGPVVEVVVTWKDRILTTYHFSGNKVVKVNAGGEDSISLPEGLFPTGHTLIEVAGGVRINGTGGVNFSVVNSAGVMTSDQLDTTGKRQGNSIRLDQGEMVEVSLPGNNLFLFVRFVPATSKVPLIPLMLSGSEMISFVGATIMVAMLALYVTTTTPKDFGEPKQEDVQRIAQVVFNNPPPKPTPRPPPPPEPPPQKTPPPPPTPPKKIQVADKKQDTSKTKGAASPAKKAETAARASEVAPKPNSQNRPKKFTSTREGGAVKTGETAGANAASRNKDVSKLGLMSAFGGGGSRAKIDQAYSGAGEVLGMADRATGTSGFNQDRAGNDLGSRFKDSGAGGKGTATQGIAGVGTKGRGSGQSAYGAAEGFGGKNSVAIESGGMEESFDPTIDKEAIRRVIRSKINEVRSCYERALNGIEKGVKLEGKVVLGWDIVQKGQAKNVKVVSSTLGNREVEDCIKRRLASWTFPEPPEGMTAEVQAYPFVLNQNK